jgi:hypothetical protein
MYVSVFCELWITVILELVLSLSMVDNSVFSPNCLTIPIDPVYPSF